MKRNALPTQSFTLWNSFASHNQASTGRATECVPCQSKDNNETMIGPGDGQARPANGDIGPTRRQQRESLRRTRQGQSKHRNIRLGHEHYVAIVDVDMSVPGVVRWGR